MNFADQGQGVRRPRHANDNAQRKSAGKPAAGGVHLRLSGAEVLISHYRDGVGLGVVTGDIRCGVSLSRAEAEALAFALLNDGD